MIQTMKRRNMEARLRSAAAAFPVISLTGPRQSGKTTLTKSTFPNHRYVSLEEPDVRERALADPRGFLSGLGPEVVLDEVQRAPDLFSYLQSSVDADRRPGRFILTGSENFLLAERISQTLAGRVAVLHLLPYSYGESICRTPLDPAKLEDPTVVAEFPTSTPPSDRPSLDDVLVDGLFPGLPSSRPDRDLWYASYEQTYVERDVRRLVNIENLDTFRRFLRLVAGRSGQLLNHASLAADAGISAPTVRSWLSLLDAAFIVFRVPPHSANFRKRLTKSEKIYFTDTGFLCRLLGIRTPDDLRYHALRGAVFETFVMTELLKSFLNRGERPPLYFWRDHTGHEIDLLLDFGPRLAAWEFKPASTLRTDFFDSIDWWQKLPGNKNRGGGIVYGGDSTFAFHGRVVRSWREL